MRCGALLVAGPAEEGEAGDGAMRSSNGRRRPHKTVKLKGCPLGDKGYAWHIDVLLAPLIRELWRLGIATLQCCHEEWPGLASIEFPGTAEAAEFLWVAQENYKAELETWDEGPEGGKVHSIQISLRVNFPTADITRLVEAFSKVERDPDGEIVPRRKKRATPP